ncbi:MAG: polyprenyl synthetase family protein [Phycisphaerales bacterium]|nr:polyprenyl synthetase family protein [Phycisphaerales bacterium]
MVISSTVLTDLYSAVRGELNAVERLFDEELSNPHPFIRELCGRVGQYRGKMLRPALVLLCGESCGGVHPAHRTLAAVVEMVHLATLVHDDVLDDAEVRRRSATINAEYGNMTAVLLGDYLISHAYHLCSSLRDQHAARTIGATTNTVCEGELIQQSRRGDPELAEGEYLQIIRSKTASLTGACCSLGAHYAGAEPGVCTSMGEFGVAAGVAFQIVDDLLDVMGDSTDTGKSVGRDLAMGTTTLPVIHCLSTADGPVRARLRAVVAGDAPFHRSDVRSWLETSDSIDYAFGVAREFVEKAIGHLSVLRPSQAKETLVAMAEFILSRRW